MSPSCSECSKPWVVYLVTAFLYVINLAVILLQVSVCGCDAGPRSMLLLFIAMQRVK